jgi:hypothetical protein
MVKCPRCGLDVPELAQVDLEILVKMREAGETVPEQVCRPCGAELRKTVRSGGGFLLAQERALEHHRQTLWKSRVNLIKKARNLMNLKAYAEAAVTYEKYLKILEIVFQCKKGEILTPEHFKDNARTSELTVVASVYWDLLRLYDTSEHYAGRQMEVAKQLALFVRYTPIFPDILKRAEVFVKQARQPEAVRAFLKNASTGGGGCFIATSAFGGRQAVEVSILRFYRDFYLQRYSAGQKFIGIYYKFSPSVAAFMDRHPALKPAVRVIVRLLIKCVGMRSHFALARSRHL